jgi:6-pyruvoyltetrahydropterin/6-carboxytetrahydropterin synthase
MFTITLSKEVVAHHILPLEGPEGMRHSHAYRIQVEVAGPRLDEKGFLMDISSLERFLEAQLSRFRDRTLNDMEEFSGMVPTLETFCHVIWTILSKNIDTEKLEDMTVTIWESGTACASYRKGFKK